MNEKRDANTAALMRIDRRLHADAKCSTTS